MILTTVTISDLPPKPKGAKRVFFTGDVHLLHPRTPTHLIADNLLHLMPPAVLGSIDAMYIVGDLWDDSRHLRHADVGPAMEFVSKLISYANAWGFGLRVLEGTPSHDHGQSKIINTMNLPVGADVVYLDKIGIYDDPKLGFKVGYVQDEYRDEARDTEDIMADIMKTQAVDRVGIFAMHGVFHYQLPIHSVRSFNEAFWETRCEYGVFIGHHHKPTRHGKIRATGSPDRLAHGEEHAKGVTIVDFYKGKAHAYFVVNERACPYRHIKDIDEPEDLYREIHRVLEELKTHPSAEYARLKITHPHHVNLKPNIREWTLQYGFKIETERLSDPEKEKVLDLAFSEAERVTTITPENLTELLLAELEGDTYDSATVESIIELVK